jgi:hypothetical protein
MHFLFLIPWRNILQIYKKKTEFRLLVTASNPFHFEAKILNLPPNEFKKVEINSIFSEIVHTP